MICTGEVQEQIIRIFDLKGEMTRGRRTVFSENHNDFNLSENTVMRMKWKEMSRGIGHVTHETDKTGKTVWPEYLKGR
jgi:hypothetical protein